MDKNDSSSEDEASMQALREVVDPTFFNETLFGKTSESVKSDNTIKEKVIEKVSLRTQKDENNQFENFGLTQSAKNFIAKQLSEALDTMIHEKKGIADKHLRSNEKDSTQFGIRLLSSGDKITEIEEEEEELPVILKPKKVKRRKVENDNLSEEEKVRAAAVDADYILSKEEIKLWTNRRKADVFRYKKSKQGVLVAITNPG